MYKRQMDIALLANPEGLYQKKTSKGTVTLFQILFFSQKSTRRERVRHGC